MTTVCSACLRARARSASPWLSAICTCTRALVSCVCMSACAWASFELAELFGRGLAAARRFRAARSRAAAGGAARAASRSCRRLRGVGLADQHVDAFDVELAELAPQLLAGLVLNHVAVVQQLQHRLLVGDVAEVRAEHRVERLRDQLLHVAEPLDHARRPLVVDVHDDRQRQQRLVGVAASPGRSTAGFRRSGASRSCR